MTQQEKIDEIMQWFNFDKVHAMMAVMGWRWGPEGEVPTVAMIESRALDLLTKVSAMEMGGRSATGGLDARSYLDGSMELMFVYENWDIDGSEIEE